MTVFVASDGSAMEVDDNGWVYTSAGRITPVDMSTLCEFFQHHTYPLRHPWEDAKTGEVWILTTADGRDEAYMVMAVRESGVVFESHHFRYSLSDKQIKSGRRIYPESD